MSFKGAPAYCPMPGFWAETQLAIQGEFRQGNEAPSSEALKLLKLDFGWRYMTVKTLRYHPLHVAGLDVRHARHWFLKLYYRYPHDDTFRRILCRCLLLDVCCTRALLRAYPPFFLGGAIRLGGGRGKM